jgi:hypothetical protein
MAARPPPPRSAAAGAAPASPRSGRGPVPSLLSARPRSAGVRGALGPELLSSAGALGSGPGRALTDTRVPLLSLDDRIRAGGRARGARASGGGERR